MNLKELNLYNNIRESSRFDKLTDLSQIKNTFVRGDYWAIQDIFDSIPELHDKQWLNILRQLLPYIKDWIPKIITDEWLSSNAALADVLYLIYHKNLIELKDSLINELRKNKKIVIKNLLYSIKDGATDNLESAFYELVEDLYKLNLGWDELTTIRASLDAERRSNIRNV